MAKSSGGSGRGGGGGTFSVVPARYAKGKVAVSTPSETDFATRAAMLAQGVGGRYSSRERAYIMSPRQAERLADYHKRGYTWNPVSREFWKPSGRRSRR